MKSEIIEIKNSDYNEKIINKIVSVILDKKVVIMPSDTIYGFLALPGIENKVREIKKRDNKPFLYLISSYSQLDRLEVAYENYKSILNKYWPGPMTFIMNSNDNTLGLRMPDWNVLKIIIKKTGVPLISTSVNFSGYPPISNINKIINTFQDIVDLIIVDPSFKEGSVSTIVDISNEPFKLIREGSVIFSENN